MKSGAKGLNMRNWNLIRLKATHIPMLVLIFLMFAPLEIYANPDQIVITEGSRRALPIAVAPFEVQAPELQDIARKVRSIVEANLRMTGLFRLVQKQAFIEQNLSIDTPPRFKDWRLIKADNVVVTRVSLSNLGELQVEYRLWDAVLSKQLTGQRFTARLKSWRRAGHLIANSIYERLIGEKGNFNTKIVYIDETGSRENRIKRLAIMDQDGFNVRLLTNGSEQVRAPRFSPVRQEIVYISQEDGEQRIYLLNIDDGRRKLLGGFPELHNAPRFSPDGDKVILSLNKTGSSKLHILNIHSGEMKQVTDGASQDTAPCFSRDGAQIVYESNNGSGRQIYITDLYSNQPKRLSKGKGEYFAPVWSPKSDLVAFIKKFDGRFWLGVLNVEDGRERILAQAPRIEHPTWAPNGRVLLFQKDGMGPNSGPRLYTIDIMGVNQRNVPTPSFGSNAAWGPPRK